MGPKEKVGVFYIEMDGLRRVAHEMGWGVRFWGGEWMSGILCIAQPARPGLIPLPAPGGGVGRRGGIRWHGVERGVDCL
jgi:hypothetical protein